MARRGRRSSDGKNKKQIGAFNYKEGKKVAHVLHYNIVDASLSRRETVGKKLKDAGIRKIYSNNKYYTVNKFLKLTTA